MTDTPADAEVEILTSLSRVCLLGDAAVGKSCLLRRQCAGVFDSMVRATPGPEVSRYVYRPEDLDSTAIDPAAAKVFARTIVNLVLMDQPGQESLVTATPQSLRDVDAAFLCFDITNPTSFEHIEGWHTLLVRHSPGALLILVGCKGDMAEARAVSKPDADALARRLDMSYFETSAKENQNVALTFKFVATALRQKWYANRNVTAARKNREKVVPLAGNVEAPKKKDCC